MRMDRVAAAAACVGVLLAGCSSEPTNNGSTAADSPAASPSDSAAEEPAGQSSSEGGSTDSLTKPFGSTFTWDDGVSVTMSKPKPFTSSTTAAPSTAKGWVAEVAVKNGSDKPLNPADFTFTSTSGETEGEQIFDPDKQVDYPTAMVLPGKTLRFKTAFTGEMNDLVVGVQYSFNARGYYK